MPIARVQTPDGRIARLEVPEGTTPEQIEAFVAENYKSAPAEGEQKNFFERVGEDMAKRAQIGREIDAARQSGEQGYIESGFQKAGKVGAGLLNDIAGEALISTGRGLSNITPDFIEKPVVKAGSDVLDYLGDTAPGRFAVDVAKQASEKYGDFQENHPRAARNIESAVDIGALLAAGKSPAGTRVADAASTTAKKGAEIAVKAGDTILHPVKTATDAVKLLDKITDKIASGASKAINRSDVPKALADLSDPEILFVKTLTNEGISVDDALGSLKAAKELKATPSVSVTSNVPQMQTQAYLTSRGSAGSKVAAQAIKDIDEVQIPSLNKKIIDQATGGRNLGAEEYGKIVGTEAKKLVDKKAAQLRTRASPYYARSIGVDKSVPIEAPEMKKALGNRLVVKALEDARTDAYTLSTTARDLAELGVDAGDIAQLPYNSTVSLHAARTQLRQLGDAAFAAGEKTKGAAIKNALADIDNAIESSFPDYKTARRIYSEDAGALKVLKDSPVGRMAQFAEGDYSKIANDLMTKDAGYIKKFVNGLGDNQKMKDSLAGAFLKRQLEEAAYEGRRFSDKVFKSEGTSERLKAIVGDERFAQMKKVDTVIDDLLKTRSIPSQSITAAAQSVKGGVDVPVDKAGLVDMVRKKIAPSLFEMVQRNPQSAARYNELLFTDEGYKLLEKISTKTKFADPKEMQAVADFLNMNADKVGAAAR